MKRRTSINTTFVLLFILSCASAKNLGKDHLTPGSCEAEFTRTKLPEGQSIWSKLAQAGGTGVSYMVTGLGYSTDMILSFTSGVVAGVAICSPLILLDTVAEDIPILSGECLGDVGVAVASATNPGLGKVASKGTERWRCPNVDPVAEGLIRVADCYKSNGEMDRAQEQLWRIENSAVFKQCLSPKLKDKVRAAQTI